MVKMAIVLVALTSVFSFADEDKGGFKLGFQGEIGWSDKIGLLFNLGNGLELGLGIGISSHSQEITREIPQNPNETGELSNFSWAIAPSVAYQLGKKDLISYGAGLDIEIASWSQSMTSSGTTLTIKPDGIDMGFIPNFYIKVEPVKNFVIGLKTGIGIFIPGKTVDDQLPSHKDTTTETNIDTATSLFVSFYL